MAEYRFVVAKDNSGEYRWNLVSTANGQNIATSGESFASKANCLENIERVKTCADADVEVAGDM